MATMVLVAGAWLGGWAWERVTPKLVAAGHNVYPLTLTGLGDRAHLSSPQITLSTHVTDIVSAIEYADLHDVVLVAHSYSGVPATIAANLIPDRISRVVYVAAVVAPAGRSLFDVFPPAAAQAFQQLADADGDGWLLPMFNDDMLDAFAGAHGLSMQDRRWLRARAAGQPIATYGELAPADLSAVGSLPRTYIVCTGDPGLPLPAGIEVVKFEAGHWPMASKPAELAALLSRIVTVPDD
ncbi:MAG TPA: alpha/beta hydrolase [Pseudonocardiaceae bacterium]|nr:alpha/beta hydrolase [Pseudonocardiaceae bacterium]